MNDQSHLGARPPSLFSRSGDARSTLEIDAALRDLEAATNPRTLLSRDPSRIHQSGGSLRGTGNIVLGMVVQAIPSVNWYKVQAGSASGWIGANMLTGGLATLGPRTVTMARPGDTVLLYIPDGLATGFILGVVPATISDGRVTAGDWISQGAGTGLKRDDVNSYPLTSMYKGGGVIDWSSGRPVDQTPYEAGWISPFGVGVIVDDFVAQVRVNELCGVFFNYVDSHSRLVGFSLDIESAVHGSYAADDEGESYYCEGCATYPWEALGLYANSTEFTSETSDKDVQYASHRGKIDLAQGNEDIDPIYRYREYGGYHGQGRMREVIRPGNTAGVRLRSDFDIDDGLFRETIGLDGSYAVVSAKSLYLGKRCRIPAPKQIAQPSDPKGDDATEGNYKHSGLFGNGDTHKISDIEASVAAKLAAVDDLIAHTLNWKALHPFHYHKKDFHTPQELDGSFQGRDQLDFDSLNDVTHMADPEPQRLRIDHRYADVNYYERESFLRFEDDGSVHIGCGYGSEIVLSGGRIRLSAPGGIELLPGTDLIAMAGQIAMKSHGSVDISSANKDVRIKAESNVQVLAGNSGTGGILLESKAAEVRHEYQEKYGEDVVSSGIVLRAANSDVVALADSVYMRSTNGDITLDAAKGDARVNVFADRLDSYLTTSAGIWFGPHGDESEVSQVYSFGRTDFICEVSSSFGGAITGYNDCDIVIDGEIKAARDIGSGGKVADRAGGLLGTVGGDFRANIESKTGRAVEDATALKTLAEADHRDIFSNGLYATTGIGSDDMLDAIGFSFRDPPAANQYGTASLVWYESRWQMLARLGMATGGSAWVEPPVYYQSEQTYPYPGKAKWTDDSAFQRISELRMFDTTSGCAADRPEPYENPELGTLESVKMSDAYHTIR